MLNNGRCRRMTSAAANAKSYAPPPMPYANFRGPFAVSLGASQTKRFRPLSEKKHSLASTGFESFSKLPLDGTLYQCYVYAPYH